MSNGIKLRVEATPKHTLDDVRAALLELAEQLSDEEAQEAA